MKKETYLVIMGDLWSPQVEDYPTLKEATDRIVEVISDGEYAVDQVTLAKKMPFTVKQSIVIETEG